MNLRDLREPADAERLEALLSDVRPDSPSTHLARHRQKGGQVIDVEVRGHPLPVAGRSLRLVVATDVTDRTRLEGRLRQSHKMEAIGLLAGGVAHDFNNVLTVVAGYGRLLLDSDQLDATLRPSVEEILRASERATGLTRQLLTFSRGRALEARVLELNEFARGIQPMIERLIGENIEVVFRTSSSPVHLLADPTQLTQVLINLAVNARDAMPDNGQLTIETASVMLAEDFAAQHPGTQPGPHAMLAVSDTGIGMDAETQSRMFEPFFTTKGEGQGTGLGLSTVFGIVKQSGGSIWAYSEPGQGTIFKVYFPELAGASSEVPPGEGIIADVERHVRVLVVEDEPVVRRVTKKLLQRLGHTVFEATNGEEALELIRRETVDVVVTDTVMPRMSGRELASRLATEFPSLPVILTSGYTADALQRQGAISDLLLFVEKPFSQQVLSQAIQEALRRHAVHKFATPSESLPGVRAIS
jgi:signal transduction histidine kinase/ActR/RegA family two-component response regulator